MFVKKIKFHPDLCLPGLGRFTELCQIRRYSCYFVPSIDRLQKLHPNSGFLYLDLLVLPPFPFWVYWLS